jgi:multiple antibiotic resistance protein
VSLEELIAAFVTLLVVIDPPGLGVIFLALTSGMNGVARRAVAIRASTIALAVLIGVALVGSQVLALLGITLQAFRIAGGLLLFTIAFEMIFQPRAERRSAQAADMAASDHLHLAAFPLAVPLISGPGAITATVLLSGRIGASPVGMLALLLTIAVVIALCLVVLLLIPTFERVVGSTVQIVFARLTGVILAALSVQFVIDGLLEIYRAM